MNKAKNISSSLGPRSYTKFKDYIEITDTFQKAHEKLPQTAMNRFTILHDSDPDSFKYQNL